MPWLPKCYLVLEGGGVKGSALVGGLKKLEEEGVQITGYAGVSAGSIVAALHAVGYPADELRAIMTKKSFLDFLDGFRSNFDLRAMLYEFPKVSLKNPLKVLALLRFSFKHKVFALARKIYNEKGLYDGKAFYEWIKKLIEARGPKDPNGRVTFGKMKLAGKDIRILAANLARRKYERFDATTYADMELADAVRASMAIPLFFKPFPYSHNYFVDGGIVSNFPAWLFAKESQEMGIPIVGFRLEGENYRKVDAFGEYCSALFNTIFEGANEIQNFNLQNIHPISIDTKSYSTLDFNIKEEDKEFLYMLGYHSVSSYIASHH
jgi:NTE family protein